jgi:DNA-binding MarR family transcriptional regulator
MLYESWAWWYHAEAIGEALRRTWKRIEAVSMASTHAPLTLTPRQERLLALLREAPRGIRELQSALGVTKPGAHFILKPLVQAGIVTRQGGYKTGDYTLSREHRP